MSLSVSCKRCGAQIIGEDEDELVAEVQTHVRDTTAGMSHRAGSSRASPPPVLRGGPAPATSAGADALVD